MKIDPKVQVTKHGSANPFAPAIYWTVADFRKMVPVGFVEHVGDVSAATEGYYRELGYTDIVIEPTGERFNRAYRITARGEQPEIARFRTQAEAERYAERISQ